MSKLWIVKNQRTIIDYSCIFILFFSLMYQEEQFRKSNLNVSEKSHVNVFVLDKPLKKD